MRTGVTIIRDGATVESGTIAELRHLTRTEITTVLDRAPAAGGGDGGGTGTDTGTSADTGALASMAGVHDFVNHDGRVTFAVDDSAMPAVLAAVAALGPRSLVANPPSLEALFLRHYAMQGDDAPTNGAVPTHGNQK